MDLRLGFSREEFGKQQDAPSATCQPIAIVIGPWFMTPKEAGKVPTVACLFGHSRASPLAPDGLNSSSRRPDAQATFFNDVMRFGTRWIREQRAVSG